MNFEADLLEEPIPPPAGSLRKNISWTFLGNLVYGGCQWLMLILLAKLVPKADVGLYTLGLAVSAPVVLLTNMHLRAVYVTDQDRKQSFATYLGLRILSSVVALFVVAIASLVLGYSRDQFVMIMLIAVSKAVEAISDIAYGPPQDREKMERIGISLSVKGVLSVAFFGVALFATRQVVAATLALIAAWTVVLFLYDFRSIRAVEPETSLVPDFHRKAMSVLALSAWPLGASMMFVSLNFNIPQILIEKHLGAALLGIFSSMLYLMELGNKIVMSVGEAAQPRLSRYFAERQAKAYEGLSLKLAGIGIVIGLTGVAIVAVAGTVILRVLFKPEYAAYGSAFLALTLASTARYGAQMLWYPMLAARYFRAQLPLVSSTALATFIGCWLLVPRYQFVGAASAMAISALYQMIVGVWVVRHAARQIAT